MTYYPATEDERKSMLDAIGAESFEELIVNIPKEIRLKGDLKIPPKLSEYEVVTELKKLSERNTGAQKISFMGGGSYDHFIPAAIGAIISRSEFSTAYTPYQAEVSQGTLQAIYEYQTMICRLTGMDVSNASMYDGGSALAEACLLAASQTRRSEIIVSGKLHPDYKKIMETYCINQNINIQLNPIDEGIADIDKLKRNVSDNTAAVIVQQPNFYGCLEDVFTIGEITKSKNALFISAVNPVSLGLLNPPGDYGADIVVSEGQPLGIPLNFGGPYLGIFAAKEDLIRKIPGRLAGITVDAEGKRAFTLTLQTREQQIRRDKATSNICTNQGLMMLAACVYLSLLGKQGLREVANLSLQKSHYLAERIKELKGFKIKYTKPFFNEFVATLPIPANEAVKSLSGKNIMAGIPLSKWGDGANELLVAVTEKRSKEEIDYFVSELAGLSG